jgi:hypothetical protein
MNTISSIDSKPLSNNSTNTQDIPIINLNPNNNNNSNKTTLNFYHELSYGTEWDPSMAMHNDFISNTSPATRSCSSNATVANNVSSNISGYSNGGGGFANNFQNSSSFMFGYTASATATTTFGNGLTASIGQLVNSSGVKGYATYGNAYGLELSAGIYTTFVFPTSSSFTANDFTGHSNGGEWNFGYFGVDIFSNSPHWWNPLGGSYFGINVGLGFGVGGAVTSTNSTYFNISKDLFILGAFGPNTPIMR